MDYILRVLDDFAETLWGAIVVALLIWCAIWFMYGFFKRIWGTLNKKEAIGKISYRYKRNIGIKDVKHGMCGVQFIRVKEPKILLLESIATGISVVVLFLIALAIFIEVIKLLEQFGIPCTLGFFLFILTMAIISGTVYYLTHGRKGG
jgi:hypothetical protein